MKKTESALWRKQMGLSLALILCCAFCLTGCKDKNAGKVTVQKTETLAHGITLVTIEASASGKTLDVAIQNALVLAVEQVNGSLVAHELDVQSLVTDYSARHSNESSGRVRYREDQNAESAVHSSASASASGPDRSAESRAESEASAGYHDNKSLDADFHDRHSQTDQSALNLRREHKSSGASGIVHDFRILQQAQDESVWQVRLIARITKYKPSAMQKRLKVAVLSFRGREGAAASVYENRIREHLISILSGAGKVAVLDRDYGPENRDELVLLTSENFNRDEAVKLGQHLGADYVLVGTVGAAVRTDSVYMETLGRRIYGDSHAKAKISYRLIEAATGIVCMSGSLMDAAPGSNLDLLADREAQKISDRILNTLYPVQVVSISNGVFYLSRGGDSMHVGDHFRVLRQGQPLKDPDTGEAIGATEEEVARVVVTEVEPKVSRAIMVGQGKVPQFDGRKMMVRSYEVASAPPPLSHAKPKPVLRANVSGAPVAGVDY